MKTNWFDPKILFYCLLAGTFMSPVMAKEWTLDALFEEAMINNPDLKTIDEGLKDADSKVSEAWGSALPSVSLQAKYNKNFEQYMPSQPANPFSRTSPYMDQNSADYSAPTTALAQDVGGLLQNLQSKEYTTTASLVVSQVIFAQGKIGTGLKIAESYKGALNSEKLATKSKVRKEVSDLFYQSLYLQEAASIYQLSIEQADRHLENVLKMEKAGLASELDRLRAQIQVEDLKSGLDKILKDKVLAMNALLNKVGLPYDESVSLNGQLQNDPEIPDYSDAYSLALSNRNELNQLSHYEDMQKQLVDLAKADYLPSIVAGGSLSKVSNTDHWDKFDWGNDANVFIQAQWNLFNGMQTHQKVVQARTEVNKISIQKQHLTQSIKLQIESEINQLKNSQNQIKVSNRMIELAERNYLLAEKAFQIGKSTQLELQDAELNLRRARLDHQKSLLDLNQSLTSLKLAMGIL